MTYLMVPESVREIFNVSFGKFWRRLWTGWSSKWVKTRPDVKGDTEHYTMIFRPCDREDSQTNVDDISTICVYFSSYKNLLYHMVRIIRNKVRGCDFSGEFHILGPAIP